MTRRTLAKLLPAGVPLWAQAPRKEPAPITDDFVCPMDREVRQRGPGKCPRCGMKLVASLPEHRDYLLDVSSKPKLIRPGEPALLDMAVRDPATRRVVRDFELVHERVFHAFLISDDLQFFAHEHPVARGNGWFRLPVRLPAAASYRMVADCYPKGGTPQFLITTLFTAGATLRAKPKLGEDRAAKKCENLTVTLRTEPEQPIAGQETLLFFDLAPGDGVQQYLAAWGHMLAASDDLIDLVHDHPLYVDGVPPPDLKKPAPSRIQFNIIFPREAMYRVWVQFQRAGVVNTAAFTLPVQTLR